MMHLYSSGYLTVTSHNFKNHLSEYLRDIESGKYRGIIVQRYGQPIGVFIPLTSGIEKRTEHFPFSSPDEKTCYKKEE